MAQATELLSSLWDTWDECLPPGLAHLGCVRSDSADRGTPSLCVSAKKTLSYFVRNHGYNDRGCGTFDKWRELVSLGTF